MQPDWNTPAGKALAELARAIRDRGLPFDRPIIIFGSAPLQLRIDPAFLSGDVDVSLPGHLEELQTIVDAIGLGKQTSDYYIEVVPEYIFRPGPNWRDRAESVFLEGVAFLLPATIDILLAKLRRLDEKDLRAFELVRQKTGGPSEQEFLHELRSSYDVFYLQKDGRKSVLWENTEKLWPRFFGRPINVRTEIIDPVIRELEQSTGDRDYIQELRARLGLEV